MFYLFSHRAVLQIQLLKFKIIIYMKFKKLNRKKKKISEQEAVSKKKPLHILTHTHTPPTLHPQSFGHEPASACQQTVPQDKPPFSPGSIRR